MDMPMTIPVEAIIGIAMLLLVAFTFSGCASAMFSGDAAIEDSAKKSFQQLVYSVKLLAFGDENVEYEYLQSTFAFKDYNVYAFNKYSKPASHVQVPDPRTHMPNVCELQTCLCLYKGNYDEDKPEDNLVQCEIIFVPDKLVNFAPGELDLKSITKITFEDAVQHRFLFAEGNNNLRNFYVVAKRQTNGLTSRQTYNKEQIHYDILIGLYYSDPVDDGKLCTESNNAPCGTKGFGPYFDNTIDIFKMDICKGTACEKGTCSWSGDSGTCLT